MTVAEFADAWVDQRTLKPRTRSMYNDLLRLHINRPSVTSPSST